MDRNTESGDVQVGEAGERVLADIDELRTAVQHRAAMLSQTVSGFVDEHPYAAMGAAFGAGYLLSGGLYSRTTRRALRLGARLLAGVLVKHVLTGQAAAALGIGIRRNERS
jgi:hypothetical protein